MNLVKLTPPEGVMKGVFGQFSTGHGISGGLRPNGGDGTAIRRFHDSYEQEGPEHDFKDFTSDAAYFNWPALPGHHRHGGSACFT